MISIELFSLRISICHTINSMITKTFNFSRMQKALYTKYDKVLCERDFLCEEDIIECAIRTLCLTNFHAYPQRKQFYAYHWNMFALLLLRGCKNDYTVFFCIMSLSHIESLSHSTLWHLVSLSQSNQPKNKEQKQYQSSKLKNTLIMLAQFLLKK